LRLAFRFFPAALLASTSALLVSSASAQSPRSVAASPAQILAPPAGYHFPAGTILGYKAEWRFFSAGVASIQLQGDGVTSRITGIANATGFVARLYHVHDVFDSAFDLRTFCSQQIHKQTEEGSRRRDVVIRFDYSRSQAVVDEFNPRNGERKRFENAIPDCAADVLTALFYAATLPLTAGSVYRFPVNDGGKTGEIEVTVEAREQIHTDAGAFNTIRVAASGSELVRHKGKIWVWFSDDTQRIPVQMRGRMGWGTLTLSLTGIEKQPATAAK